MDKVTNTLARHAAELQALRTRIDQTYTTLYALLRKTAGISLAESATPTHSLVESAQVDLYLKDDKLVLRFDDAGTTRYKYLDLSGTGVTWVHTTSEP